MAKSQLMVAQALRTVFFKYHLLILAFVTIGLASCQAKQPPEWGTFSTQSGLTKTLISTPPFTLTTFHSPPMEQPAQDLYIYIEGDGRAYISKTHPSGNPTPHTPVGLYLAAADRTHAVAYLGRPCQHTPSSLNPACKNYKWWTKNRFDRISTEALANAANQLITQFNPARVHLVGFSGGGFFAMELATQLKNVVSIRTVAGNLVPNEVNRWHRVTHMPAALNPMVQSEKLANIPQIHYVGGQDKVIPPALTRQMLSHYPHQRCTQVRVIHSNDHLHGWQAMWPTLVMEEPHCAK